MQYWMQKLRIFWDKKEWETKASLLSLQVFSIDKTNKISGVPVVKRFVSLCFIRLEKLLRFSPLLPTSRHSRRSITQAMNERCNYCQFNWPFLKVFMISFIWLL